MKNFFLKFLQSIHQVVEHEKCCQMSVRLFSLFWGSIYQQWSTQQSTKCRPKERTHKLFWFFVYISWENIHSFMLKVIMRWSKNILVVNCNRLLIHRDKSWLQWRLNSHRNLHKNGLIFVNSDLKKKKTTLLSTLEFKIDVEQGINVRPGNFVKKNKHRVLNKHRARTKCAKFMLQKYHQTWKYL